MMIFFFFSYINNREYFCLTQAVVGAGKRNSLKAWIGALYPTI